jgi:hypothetical protein
VSDPRTDWQKELAITPQCVPVTRLGEELSQTELDHTKTCARCQAELALFAAFERESDSSDEAGQVEWIASELRQRLQHAPAESNVKTFEPRRRNARTYGLAAAAVLALTVGGLWMQNREPAIESPLNNQLYRTTRLEAVSPLGDVPAAPSELRWTAVETATSYSVRLMEVDRAPLWSGDTSSNHAAVPADVAARFAPGKTVLWEVTALRGTTQLASSGIQKFRVAVR